MQDDDDDDDDEEEEREDDGTHSEQILIFMWLPRALQSFYTFLNLRNRIDINHKLPHMKAQIMYVILIVRLQIMCIILIINLLRNLWKINFHSTGRCGHFSKQYIN